MFSAYLSSPTRSDVCVEQQNILSIASCSSCLKYRAGQSLEENNRATKPDWSICLKTYRMIITVQTTLETGKTLERNRSKTNKAKCVNVGEVTDLNRPAAKNSVPPSQSQRKMTHDYWWDTAHRTSKGYLDSRTIDGSWAALAKTLDQMVFCNTEIHYMKWYLAWGRVEGKLLKGPKRGICSRIPHRLPKQPHHYMYLDAISSCSTEDQANSLG